MVEFHQNLLCFFFAEQLSNFELNRDKFSVTQSSAEKKHFFVICFVDLLENNIMLHQTYASLLRDWKKSMF